MRGEVEAAVYLQLCRVRAESVIRDSISTEEIAPGTERQHQHCRDCSRNRETASALQRLLQEQRDSISTAETAPGTQRLLLQQRDFSSNTETAPGTQRLLQQHRDCFSNAETAPATQRLPLERRDCSSDRLTTCNELDQESELQSQNVRPSSESMSSVGHIIIREIPKSTGNGAGEGLIREIPTVITNGVAQVFSKEIAKGAANGASQGFIREKPIKIPNGGGAAITRETGKDAEQEIANGLFRAANILGYNLNRDTTRETANGVDQGIPRGIPGHIANGRDIIRGSPKDIASNVGCRAIQKDSSNDGRQSILKEIPKDTSNIGEQGIFRGAPRDTSNGGGQSTIRGPKSDTSTCTAQRTTGGKRQDGSHRMGCKRLGGPDKNGFLGGLRPGLWTVLAPALLATLCFARSLAGEFVHDDVWAILNNPDSQGETPWRNLFVNDFWGKAMSDNTSHKSYRPLCVLSFRINVLLCGLDPFYFHAVNVLLHCVVSTLLLYTCGKAVFEDRKEALAAALLFSAHPVHTEAVAGIVGRADVMSCLLFLLAFLSYIRSVEIGPALDRLPSTSSPFFLTLCLLLGTCAMLVKETGVTVFGVCLVYDLLILCPKRFKRPPSSDHPRNIWYVAGPFLKRAALVSCYVALVLYFRVRLMGESMPLFSEQDNPASFSPYLLTRFLTYSYLLAFNTWLLLAPITLCYDWQVGSIPLIHTVWDVRNLGTLLLLGILLSLGLHCLTSAKRMEHREVLVGLLFLIFPFIPASNLFFRVGFVVAERVLYMPSMGFCILCVHGLKVLYSRTGPRGSSVLTLCFLLLLVLFSCKSISQSECWKSREALFRSGVQTMPHNAKVHYNYANFLKDQNRRDEARNHYRTVLRLYPLHPSALNNLGTLTTNATAAEEYYRKALAISPQHSRALFNLGNLLRTQGRNAEAELLLRDSLLYGPYFADAYSSLGSLLADQKRHKEADEVYQAGIRNCPESSDLQNNYGVFLVDVGAAQEATSHYLLALRLRPDHHVAMLNLGRLYRSLGQNTEAEMWYKKALQISRDADVISPLGALYYNTGKYEEALRLYHQAVALHPDNVQIRLSLAQVLAVAGQTTEAETLVYRIADDVPDCVECFRLLSAIYSKQENFLKALDTIDVALKMKNTDPKIMSELYFSKGNHLRELNRLEDAFESYRLVAKLNPSQAQAWMNMGGIKHIQADYATARTFYQKALQLDPNSKLLKENLAKLQRLENRLRGAKGKDPDLSLDPPKKKHQKD
ncbi:protein O-mannosyl-transferase TMTC1 [Pelodytes ibericus]